MVIQAGFADGRVSGADHGLLSDPSKIAGMGLAITEPVLAALDNASVFDKGGFGMMFISGTGYLCSHRLLFRDGDSGLHRRPRVLLDSSRRGTRCPSVLGSPPRFIRERASGAVIATGIELMLLSLVLAASGSILAEATKGVTDSATASGGISRSTVFWARRSARSPWHS